MHCLSSNLEDSFQKYPKDIMNHIQEVFSKHFKNSHRMYTLLKVTEWLIIQSLNENS